MSRPGPAPPEDSGFGSAVAVDAGPEPQPDLGEPVSVNAALRGTRAAALRPAWAEIDLAALRHNVALLLAAVAPARLCAVVKADGYGHGASSVARAAVEAGAAWLAVALVDEGLALRSAGISEDVLVLSEPAPEVMNEVVTARLTPAVYTPGGIEALRRALRSDHQGGPFPVHLKVDTGMHRAGAAPCEAVSLARQIAETPELHLGGTFTDLAVADEPTNAYTAGQLRCFDEALRQIRGAGLDPGLVHAANSAGALWHPSSHYDLVRCGTALYGLAPSRGPHSGVATALRPVLSLKARVSYTTSLPAGERLSYGLRYQLARPSEVATVPLGYGDGVPRGLSAAGGEVLIRGRRYPIAGTVTMDQILVDCGPVAASGGGSVTAGEEVVLIGRQDGEEITAWEWAALTGTIAYEVVCGIGPRVPRVNVGDLP